MATGTAALHEAIFTAWNLSETLRSGHAEPGEPLPYVVFQQQASVVVGRHSRSGVDPGSTNRIDMDVPIEFRCYGETSGSQTGKEVVADIADRIKRVYGGHPLNPPDDLTLDVGGVGWSRLETEDDEYLDEGIHMWRLAYTFKLDMPVRV